MHPFALNIARRRPPAKTEKQPQFTRLSLHCVRSSPPGSGCQQLKTLKTKWPLKRLLVNVHWESYTVRQMAPNFMVHSVLQGPIRHKLQGFVPTTPLTRAHGCASMGTTGPSLPTWPATTTVVVIMNMFVITSVKRFFCSNSLEINKVFFSSFFLHFVLHFFFKRFSSRISGFIFLHLVLHFFFNFSSFPSFFNKNVENEEK